MTETEIQKQIIVVARQLGYKAYRMNAGGRRNYHGAEDGTPDLLVLMPGGRSLWVEVKRPKEQPKPNQRERHKELRALGHAVCVCHSAEEFVESVREL